MQKHKKDEEDTVPLIARHTSSEEHTYPPSTNSPSSPPPTYSHHKQASGSFLTSKSPLAMASFMMSPYPAEHAPTVPHASAHSNGYEGEVNANERGLENGEYQPHLNPQAMGSYNWRSDDYQDQGAALSDKRKAALEEVDNAYFS